MCLLLLELHVFVNLTKTIWPGTVILLTLSCESKYARCQM